MLKYRFVVMAAGVMLASAVGNSEASDRNGHRHGHQYGRGEAIIGGNGLPSYVPGIGTFAGSISAVRFKGNGVYIAVDRAPRLEVITYRAPKAKIIEISTQDPEAACSFEAGVCVIRPQN